MSRVGTLVNSRAVRSRATYRKRLGSPRAVYDPADGALRTATCAILVDEGARGEMAPAGFPPSPPSDCCLCRASDFRGGLTFQA